MTQTTLSWQLAVHGATRGAGFVVAPGTALTCTHVVGGQPTCWLDAPHDPGKGWRCDASPADPTWHPRINRWPDITVVRLPGLPLPPAPLSSARRPRPDTTVEVLGFPKGFEVEGQRTRARVAGPDASGQWLQLDPVQDHGGWITEGYSGAAAVDTASGLVVGMVAWATIGGGHPRIAWLIPLDTIARYWPPLHRILPGVLESDPRYTEARRHLAVGRYDAALDGFLQVAGDHDQPGPAHYRCALAGLGGVRPGSHAAPTIAGVERLLGAALTLDPAAAAVAALWATVKEDYFLRRGLDPGPPSLDRLRQAAAGVSPEEATEIVRHVPAAGCITWEYLRQRSGT